MSKLKIGDLVVTVESQYLIGHPNNPIPTGTPGILRTRVTQSDQTVWVDFNGDIQCVYLHELRLATKLEKALK